MRSTIFTKHNAGSSMKYVYPKVFDWVANLECTHKGVDADIAWIIHLLGSIRKLEHEYTNKDLVIEYLVECIRMVEHVNATLGSEDDSVTNLLNIALKRIK